MDQPDDKPKPKRGFWDWSREQQAFSGFIGTLVIAAVTLGGIWISDKISSPPSSGSSPSPAVTESTGSGEADQDGDFVSDSVDGCPREPGLEPSGCPDGDSDGVLDSLDRCPEAAGDATDGCPTAPRSVGLVDWAEQEGHEVLLTENSYVEQVTVGGITDPYGLMMELGESSRSAGATIFANGALRMLKGQVGVTSEPCSAGSTAYVSIRNGEGEQLWPEGGRPKAVHRTAVSFEISIAGEEEAVLYAQAPEVEEGECGAFNRETRVGWVHGSVTK
jgi:hypothetical protein